MGGGVNLSPRVDQRARNGRRARGDRFWLEPGVDLGRAATAPVGLPGAAAAQTRPHGSAGLGARPGWAVQRRSRGRPRPRGPGRAKWAQNGFLGVSGAE